MGSKERIIVIPARYGSTRLPGKPLLPLAGKPLIQWVCDNARRSRLCREVVVATDDRRIMDAVAAFGGNAVMTGKDLASGTDRVHEALVGHEALYVVNVQGDEPFIRPDMIDALFIALESGDAMATLCAPLATAGEYENPNTVKVVRDVRGLALYFSRAPIPFLRQREGARVYKHIGVYGYSRAFLATFVSLGRGMLEGAESLEQLRALENGYPIRVVETTYDGFGIDTPEDLERAARFVQSFHAKGGDDR